MKQLQQIRDFIIKVLDWLYPPFSRLMPRQIFRYAATGGANTALDIILYAIVYTFILDGRMLNLGFVTISDHIAAFILVFPITFFVGFILARFITFTNSHLGGGTQLIRYFTTVIGSITLNYLLLKLFVEVLNVDAVITNIINKVIVIAYSYFAQTYFSFRSKKGTRYV